MAVKLQQVTNLINLLAPKHLACGWDNIGLQIGDYNQEVNKVLVSLDVNEEVVDEAIENNIDLIIVHHPVIFKGISNIVYNTPLGRIIQKAIKADIAIYVAHTNYDIAQGGLNDILAELLGLVDIDVLQVTASEDLKKLVVFVPEESVAELKSAVGKAGAGWIGNYSDCFFEQEGVGNFRPLEGTTPYTGTIEELSRVKEYRLETIVPSRLLNKVISKMIKAHPYEEVAYDIYPLDNRGDAYGVGRVGYLEESTSLRDYTQLLKNKLGIDSVRVVGNDNSKIKKVAICAGSGADFVKAASFKGADLLVTGDVKYHQAQLVLEEGMTLIDAGHYETEQIMRDAIVGYLNSKVEKNNLAVEVMKSQVNTNPFRIV